MNNIKLHAQVVEIEKLDETVSAGMQQVQYLNILVFIRNRLISGGYEKIMSSIVLFSVFYVYKNVQSQD